MVESYVTEPIASERRGRRRRMLSLYLGLAVLLAAASLVAINAGAGHSASPRWIIHPKAGSACTTPPNGYSYVNTVDGTLMQVCVSQEGNINGFFLGSATNQIAWDGYCLFDFDSAASYTDYSPGSGASFTGWAAATLTVAASDQINMTRQTLDGKYQLTEFIKMNLQPRSVFVGMTIKNVDSATHHVGVFRSVAPRIDGSAADDEYNEFSVGLNANSTQYGRTGQAYGGTGGNSLLFGPTQTNGVVFTEPAVSYTSNACTGTGTANSGHVGPGTPQAFLGFLGDPSHPFTKMLTLAPNASVNGGKFVYRML
jgi:hypothetical protein